MNRTRIQRATVIFLFLLVSSSGIAQDTEKTAIDPHSSLPSVDKPSALNTGLLEAPLYLGDRSKWIYDSMPDSSKPYWQTNLFKRVFTDQAFLWTQWWPSEVRRPGFSVPILISLAGASGSSGEGFDLKLQRWIEDSTTGTGRDMATVFSRLGDTRTGAVLLGTTYLVSRIKGDERLRRTTSLSAEALINAAIYSTLLKATARRTRPVADGTGDFFVSDLEHGQSSTSFPSGHAMGAFSVATVFAPEYGHRRWVPWVSYGTASAIALSRVSLGRHFPSDVVAGATLGISLGKMVVHRNDKDGDRRLISCFEPYYDPGSGGTGVAFRYTW